jgi:hypothetical protein
LLANIGSATAPFRNMKTASVYVLAIFSGIVFFEMLRVISKFNIISMQGDVATGVSFWSTTVAILGLSAAALWWSIRWIWKRRGS